MGEKASKGRFLQPEKLQNHSNEGKGKRKRKGEEKERRRREKKAIVAFLDFIIATLGPFGDNVFKIRQDIHSKE